MEMREWLTLIVALLILAVVLDGIRRMRNARRSALRMSRKMPQGGGSRAEPDSYGSELPNGGARVVNVRKSDDAEERYRQIRQSREVKKRRLGRTNRIPEQVALNLDEQVPTLMEVEREEQSASESAAKTATAASQTEQPQEDMLELVLDFDDDRIEPQLSGADLNDPVREQSTQSDKPAPSSRPEAKSATPARQEAPAETATELDEEEEFREPEDVLVINVMAPKGQFFAGDRLLETVLDCGMRFGSMDIFHHHAGARGEGGVLYSMANIVVPGTFELAGMDDFRTPGVSLFLALPVDADSSQAFESMLRTAKTLASELGGELKDENRSVLTSQTVEHYRSRIKEFERKRLSRAPA